MLDQHQPEPPEQRPRQRARPCQPRLTDAKLFAQRGPRQRLGRDEEQRHQLLDVRRRPIVPVFFFRRERL
jgi:hypothetical protein